MTGGPGILILDGLTPFGGSVSVRSRALRFGQLGSSERYFKVDTRIFLMPDLLQLPHGFIATHPSS